MTLMVASLPDDPAALTGWLEKALVGLDLPRLVAELATVHGASPGEAPSLREALGDHLLPVCQAGLSGAPRPLLQQLLTRPALLLELQELVLLHGSPYWDEVARRDEALERLVSAGRQRLAGVAPQPSAPAAQAAPVARLAWYRRPWLVSLATAAAVLLGVLLWQRARQPEKQEERAEQKQPTRPDKKETKGGPVEKQSLAWGWDRPGALPAKATRAEYLNALAKSAEEWFNKRPKTPVELARRIGELRQGCSTLLLTPHPLPAADDQWLVKSCRGWAARLEGHLADLEAGQDLEEVRKAADTTVAHLVKSLRHRAAGPA